MSNKFETDLAEIGRGIDRIVANKNEQIQLAIELASQHQQCVDQNADMETEIERLYKRIGELTNSRAFWQREAERLADEVRRLREAQRTAPPPRTMEYINGQRLG